MIALFQERQRDFHLRCLKYSRYVLNDHFVLVLLVLFGFLLLQYREFLDHFPKKPWPVYLLLLVVTILFLLAGRIGTYLEPADQHFLLTKEQEVQTWIHMAKKRQFFLWGGLQILGQLFVYPLYMKLGVSPFFFLGYLLLLTGLKFLLIKRKLLSYQKGALLKWDLLLEDEQKRQQKILQFFALFTTVKGITSTVKRRSYLDGMLTLITKKQANTWPYLFVRAFFRTGDFWSLGLRLACLSLLVLVTVDLSWLAVGLVCLFDYLLLFQLLSLYRVFDGQTMSRLYPLSHDAKSRGLLYVLRMLSLVLLSLQLMVGLVLLKEKIYLFLLPVFMLIVNSIYLPIKAKKLID